MTARLDLDWKIAEETTSRCNYAKPCYGRLTFINAIWCAPNESLADDGGERRERERGGAGAQSRGGNEESFRTKCLERSGKWTCENLPLWQAYAKLYAEKEEKLEEEDKLRRRKAAYIPRFPRVQSVERVPPCHHKYFPLGAFHQEKQTRLPNKLERDKKIRIWKKMRAASQASLSRIDVAADAFRRRKTDGGLRPCSSRDVVAELKNRLKSRGRKRRDLFPCDRDEAEDRTFYDAREDFAERKELGHARIPPTCPKASKMILVDRPAGENPGLVDGDYLLVELDSADNGQRAYANVCLRGLKGMHLPELAEPRNRRKTWKFCFYQALVALLAKTQLRYKYAWSANVDYIYDHAWMLFVHMGTINVKNNQRLDDVVVYNYKYSVELELVQESVDVPVVKNVGWNYTEAGFKRQIVVQRRELMDTKLGLGWEKITDRQDAVVHEEARQIEEWLDKLPDKFRNCVFRTSRYSLAFWQDGNFWYLYNPYRCDEFGFWDDDGYACIVKFCSRESLRRHLMILLLRAYADPVPRRDRPEPEPFDRDVEYEGEAKGDEIERVEEEMEGEERENPFQYLPDQFHQFIEQFNEEIVEDAQECYVIQIFNLIYHCCQVHNLKVLERGAPKGPLERVEKKEMDDCPFDPADVREPCEIETEEEEEDSKERSVEKASWLKSLGVTWASCSSPLKKTNEGGDRDAKEIPATGKTRWHQYLVEESGKLFSLWGEVHITDGIFERENRGMQTYACYVVGAGMTRITAPEYWTSKTLDAIVMCGDRYYTHSKLEAELKSTKAEFSHVVCWDKYLTSHFKIGETMFEAKVLPAICGRLYVKSGKSLWRCVEQMFLKHHFGILSCEGSCLGIFKFCGAYYALDVNSYGPPLFPYGKGSSYLLRATFLSKFLGVLVLSIDSPECSRFALNPIEILEAIDVGPEGFPATRTEAAERKPDCPRAGASRGRTRTKKLGERANGAS